MAFFGLFNTEKAAQPQPVRRVSTFGGFLSGFGGRVSAPDLSVESALETAAVLSATKTIAGQISSTPIRVMQEYEKDGLTHKKYLKDHPANRLLGPRGKPNNWQTPQEFIESMMINALLGRGALASKTIVNGRVTELIPVPTGAWSAIPMTDNSVTYEVALADGSITRYTQEQVVFWRGISIDNYTSVSMLDKARKAVGISHYLEDQQLQLASSGGNPSGVLSFEGELPAERKTAIREQWNAAYGASGTGGIAILDANTKFNPVSMTMADSQFIENRKFQIEEVARVFGIQPLFLGHIGGINPDGVDAAMRFHVKNCLMPWYFKLEQALNRDLLGNDTSLYFDFDERELMRGDLKAQMEAYTLGLGSGGIDGVYSVNEVREILGENPINEDWAKTPIKGAYRSNDTSENN